MNRNDQHFPFFILVQNELDKIIIAIVVRLLFITNKLEQLINGIYWYRVDDDL